MSAASDLLLPHVEAAVRDRALIRATNQIRIEASALQEAAWARGAALLIAEKVLEPMFLQSVQAVKLEKEVQIVKTVQSRRNSNLPRKHAIPPS